MKNFLYKLLPTFQLVGIFFCTALLMAVYELLKETYFKGELTLWESHTITVIVTAIFATIVAFFMRNLGDNLVKEAQEAQSKVTGINAPHTRGMNRTTKQTTRVEYNPPGHFFTLFYTRPSAAKKAPKLKQL